MKLIRILASQALRTLRVSARSGHLYMPDFVTAMSDRYGFLGFPESMADFNPSRGVTFSHGKFTSAVLNDRREIVIDRFQIFDNGVVADTAASVEDADAFLDEILAWAFEHFELSQIAEHPVRKLFQSQVEIQSDVDLVRLLSSVDLLGRLITESLQSNGHDTPLFGAYGFSLTWDPAERVTPAPMPFKFERREGRAFGDRVFFSSAPLTTADHLRVIEQLELL